MKAETKKAIKKIIKRENIKNIEIPDEMGEYVEIIILPAKNSDDIEEEDSFEIITEDGKFISIPNWTEEEWNQMSLYSFLNSCEDSEDWGDIFDNKNR